MSNEAKSLLAEGAIALAMGLGIWFALPWLMGVLFRCLEFTEPLWAK